MVNVSMSVPFCVLCVFVCECVCVFVCECVCVSVGDHPVRACAPDGHLHSVTIPDAV